MAAVSNLRSRLSLAQVTEGAPILPLAILFGLNCVDELDRSAYNVLIPEIRHSFHLSIQGIVTVTGIALIAAYLIQVPIGYYADRHSRIRIAGTGAAVWGFFTLMTGLAPTIALLAVSRGMTAIGRAVNDPTHNSLISDYYEPNVRTKVYGVHRAANPVGQILGALGGGTLAFLFGWRTPFIVFAVPTLILVILAFTKLREPLRGSHERRATGASDEVIATEEKAPSFGEGWRLLNQIKTLRRIWLSLPFLATAIAGLGILLSTYYKDVFNLNEFHRGVVAAITEPFQLLGIVVGVPIATRLMRRDPSLVLKFLALAGLVTAGGLVLLSVAPNLPLAIAANIIVSSVLGVLLPGLYATLSLAIPPKARSLGFSIGALYVVAGLPIVFVIGGIADSVGIRGGILMLMPVFLLGAFILASAGGFLAADIDKVRTSAAAQAEVLAGRRKGEVKLLLVKKVDVAYDTVQVLFGVDFEVDEGEIVALLGTNGAGKSTLLRAISGLVPASAGAIVFDGEDMTFAPPHEIARRGVVQVPGGRGVFPSLTVAENLRIAGWLYLREGDYLKQATEEVLNFFPVLRERWEQLAGNLSGGEQQMLTLAQAFIARPKLLMIDELSLGLAPTIVEQLLKIVTAIRDRGTTIILVEQSVNLALTVAETAYFMEKGEIRFHGPTSQLLKRPDVLRSVFLEGAASMDGLNGRRGKANRRRSAASVVASNGDRAVVLEVNGLAKRYGGITAVDDVDLALHQSEILGVIGPNGAGKTTLFDLISGFIPRDAGRVTLDGEDVTDLSADARARRGLGRSFQDARLFPALTVLDTVKLALERHVAVRDPVAAALLLPAVADSEREVATRADELIELMGLSAFSDKFVSELSTGSRRIVDLACVLAHEPQVILFDEPSSGIAQRETEALGPLLLRIRDATHASLLVIEHDMPLVTSIADRLIALDMGRVVTDGPPAEVVRHPDVVASYLGTSNEVFARSGTRRRRVSTKGK
jgi:ABC-type branched-subunit amino acid transport system ATPase component/predicted MFS family arabinose efflux permease